MLVYCFKYVLRPFPLLFLFWFFFFKQKTASEWRIGDWSSYVCSSDLRRARADRNARRQQVHAAGSRDLGLRRESGRLPARADGDDRFLATLWPLGRRLRPGGGGVLLGAEIADRRQGRLCLAARRTSRARRRLYPLGRLHQQEQGSGVSVHPVAEQ